MTNFVQLYKSTDTNAPSLTGSANSLITLLNKCLVDGYVTASVSSITRIGTTATAVLASSNISLVTGNYVTISGAAQSDYNGTFLITSIDSLNFTYQVANSPVTPATGTLLYAKASLGWTKPFAAGTNSQTYRSADATTNQFYLQIIDNGATAGTTKEAQVYGAEVMTADQAVTVGQFPTVGFATTGMCWRKSDTADATVRPWTIIGDGRVFYLQTQPSSAATVTAQLYGFGHFATLKLGDSYNTFLAAGSAFNTTNTLGGLIAAQPITAINTATAGMIIARSFTQVGIATNGNICGFGGTFIGGVTCIGYPNAADTGYYVNPVFVGETVFSGTLRGRLLGFYNSLHSNPLSNWDTVTGVTGLPGITLITLVAGSGTIGQGMFDVFGPWS